MVLSLQQQLATYLFRQQIEEHELNIPELVEQTHFTKEWRTIRAIERWWIKMNTCDICECYRGKLQKFTCIYAEEQAIHMRLDLHDHGKDIKWCCIHCNGKTPIRTCVGCNRKYTYACDYECCICIQKLSDYYKDRGDYYRSLCNNCYNKTTDQPELVLRTDYV